MKLVTAIIRPGKLLELEEELFRQPIERFTVTSVLGSGSTGTSGKSSTLEVDLLKKMKIEIEVSAEHVLRLTQTIIDVCKTGKTGDGKIFVVNIPDGVVL
jgi:nitrogen regulatory protein PII